MLVLKTSCAKVLVGSDPTVGVARGELLVLMRDGIGKRYKRIRAIPNRVHVNIKYGYSLKVSEMVSCVVQIHTASI